MEIYKTFIKKIGLIGLSNVLISLSSLFLIPILTKNLSIAEYGMWVQIVVTVGLIPNIITLGLPFSMIRFLASSTDITKIREGFYSIFLFCSVIALVFSLLLFIFSGIISRYLLTDTLIIKMLAILLFFACLNIITLNFFRTFQKMVKYNLFSLMNTYIGFFLIIILILITHNIIGALIGLLVSYILLFIISFSYIVSEIGFKLPKFNMITKYLSFGLPTIPGNLSNWIIDSSDRYIIGIILGVSFVGLYNPGYTLGNIIMMFATPFSILLPSILANHFDKNENLTVETILEYSFKYFILLTIPAVFGLTLLSKSLLYIIATPDIAITGYLITPFTAISSLLFGAGSIIAQILILKMKTRTNAIIGITAAILNLILNLLLISYIGLLGAALATLIAYIITFGLKLFYSFKFIKFNLNIKLVIKCIISSIFMSTFIILINPTTIINIIITIGISTIIYTMSILILKGITKEEFKYFKQLLQLNRKST
jgi:O-antigen/teichoic acid export membrane protein